MSSKRKIEETEREAEEIKHLYRHGLIAVRHTRAETLDILKLGYGRVISDLYQFISPVEFGQADVSKLWMNCQDLADHRRVLPAKCGPE